MWGGEAKDRGQTREGGYSVGGKDPGIYMYIGMTDGFSTMRITIYIIHIRPHIVFAVVVPISNKIFAIVK